MEIKTDRVKLRRFGAGDLANMRRLESDPDVVKFTRIRKPISEEQSRVRLDKLLSNPEPPAAPLGVWAAEFKATSEFIGWFMLLPNDQRGAELGYMIVKELWGQGLVSEITRELVRVAFTDKYIVSLNAVTDPENRPSVRILEKLGFQLVKEEENSLCFELKNPIGFL